tara:strand:- start:516 stop:650 length:135 start_codon:yes stop_codon:yes gene_type:complete
MADVVLIDDPQVKRQVTFSKSITNITVAYEQITTKKILANNNYY